MGMISDFLFFVEKTRTNINGLLTGKNGEIVSTTIDTSTLTNKNDHVPSSAAVKSALDALLPSAVGYESADNPVIVSGSGTLAVAKSLSAGIYFVEGHLSIPSAYVGYCGVNLIRSDGNVLFAGQCIETTNNSLAKHITVAGIIQLTSATNVGMYTIGFGSGITNGTLAELRYYKLK